MSITPKQLLLEDDDRPGGGGILDSATGTIEVYFVRALYKSLKDRKDRSKQMELGGAVSEKSKKGAMSLVTE